MDEKLSTFSHTFYLELQVGYKFYNLAGKIELVQRFTFLIDDISPWINLGGVQLIPTATTFLHDSAIEAHSRIESPLTTLMPSLELNENHAGIFTFSSSKSSA